MKKFLCLFLAIIMMFALASCNDEKANNNSDDSNGVQYSTSVSDEESGIPEETESESDLSYEDTNDNDADTSVDEDESDLSTDTSAGSSDSTEADADSSAEETPAGETSSKKETDKSQHQSSSETSGKSSTSTKSPAGTTGKNNQTATSSSSSSSGCSHNYKVTSTVKSTCTKNGSKTYTCTKCGSSYKDPLELAAHNYSDATCTSPKTCKSCFKTSGDALGHSYGSDNKCTRCGVANTSNTTQDFTVSVKTDKSVPVADVTVSIYDSSSPSKTLAKGKTNSSGVYTANVKKCSSYRIVLSDVPNGYKAEESYTATSTSRLNIKLKYVVVEDPNDHSYANYKVGSQMWDFTVTDTDGNTYNLSQLLKENELVILDFWYVTCTPCKSEFPYFEAALDKYGDRIELLAMNHFDSESSIEDLRSQLEVTFPMISEDLGFREAFNITNYPTTVIINSSGKIVSIHRSAYESEEAFLKAIESFLKK